MENLVRGDMRGTSRRNFEMSRREFIAGLQAVGPEAVALGRKIAPASTRSLLRQGRP